MAKADSTTSSPVRKSAKSDCPIWLHKASGQWCIKRKNRFFYLGFDKDEALQRYYDNEARINAGRPLADQNAPDEFTVGDACQQFIKAKQTATDIDELSLRTFNDYVATADRVKESFGKNTPVAMLTREDFTEYRNAFAKTRNPIGVGNEITRVKTIFKWCFDNELCALPRYGTEFKRPPKKLVEIHKHQQGKKTFSAEHIRLLLDELGVQMRAMVLLGINAGFGNADCGNLPIDAVDLENGVIDWWRPKTGVARRAILWTETIEALRRAFDRRPTPQPEAEDCFFVNLEGLKWAKDDETTNPISKATTYALKRLKIHRKGMSFYRLRHSFRTVADEVKDQPAADLIMGHVTPGMASNYRHEISDERLRAISAHVHQWLFGKEQEKSV